MKKVIKSFSFEHYENRKKESHVRGAIFGYDEFNGYADLIRDVTNFWNKLFPKLTDKKCLNNHCWDKDNNICYYYKKQYVCGGKKNCKGYLYLLDKQTE